MENPKRSRTAASIMLEVKDIKAEDMNKLITIDIEGFGMIKFRGNDFARLLARNSTTAELGAALYNYGYAAGVCFPEA